MALSSFGPSQGRYNSPRFRAFITTICLALFAVSLAASVLFWVWNIQLAHGLESASVMPSAEEIDEQEMLWETLRTALTIPFAATYVLTVVFFIAWVHRSAKTLDELNIGTDFSPKSAVLWLLIPFANFWKARQFVNELYFRSHPERATSLLINPWWYLWIAGNLLAVFARPVLEDFGGLPDEDTFSRLYLESALQIFENLLLLTATVLLIILIWRITKQIDARNPLSGSAPNPN